MMITICPQGLAGCPARRTLVAYNANRAHGIGFLLLVPISSHCPHTLACCALSSIAEWKTSYWQQDAQKDINRRSSRRHQPLGSNTSSCKTSMLCFGSNDAGVSPWHLGAKGWSENCLSFHWLARQSLIDCPITISLTPPSTNRFRERAQRAELCSKGLRPAQDACECNRPSKKLSVRAVLDR